MFDLDEYEYDPKTILRIPVLEGQNFQNLHNDDYVIQARIERPLLPKDVLEYRSQQARNLDTSGCIFDENHRLIGRRITTPVRLSGIPEGEAAGLADDASFLSVGGVTATGFSTVSTQRLTVSELPSGPERPSGSEIHHVFVIHTPFLISKICEHFLGGSSSSTGARPSNFSYVVLTQEESRRYFNWADATDDGWSLSGFQDDLEDNQA